MATQRTALMPAIQTRRLLQKGGGAAGAHEKRLKKCRALPTSLLREGKSSALRNVGACLFLKSCGDQPGFRQWAAGVFLARREVSIGIQAGSRANKPSLIIWPWTNSKNLGCTGKVQTFLECCRHPLPSATKSLMPPAHSNFRTHFLAFGYTRCDFSYGAALVVGVIVGDHPAHTTNNCYSLDSQPNAQGH